MSRTRSRTLDVEWVLQPARLLCPPCGRAMRIRYENRRTLVTLMGTQRLRLKIRRCEAEGCARFPQALPPGGGRRTGASAARVRPPRDGPGGSLAPPRPSLCAGDLAVLLHEMVEAVGVPVAGVIIDGQHSIRKAVVTVLPEVPHQLCHFHFLREAALPIFEADRHVKKELKKAVRGVRPIERAVEGRTDPGANLVRGYASAVRSAITDDGRAPLDAAGLRLNRRLEKVSGSLERVRSKGGPRARSRGSRS